jgi:uroporphyrinogen-III synthase
MPDALMGKRILVTRGKGQNAKLIKQLEALGAIPVEFPTIDIVAADPAPLIEAINNAARYHWLIFTSANGVTYFWQQAAGLGKRPDDFQDIRLASVGPATGEALRKIGLLVDLMPAEHTAEALLAAFGSLHGQRVLWPAADIARPILEAGLRAKGAIVERVTAYQTRPVAQAGELPALLPTLDILTFTSASTVHNFVNLLPPGDPAQAIAQAQVACIGPVTAEAARKLGLPVHIVAGVHTIPGLVESLTNPIVA